MKKVKTKICEIERKQKRKNNQSQSFLFRNLTKLIFLMKMILKITQITNIIKEGILL